jgi:hypothetical protein
LCEDAILSETETADSSVGGGHVCKREDSEEPEDGQVGSAMERGVRKRLLPDDPCGNQDRQRKQIRRVEKHGRSDARKMLKCRIDPCVEFGVRLPEAVEDGGDRETRQRGAVLVFAGPSGQ